MEQEGMNLGAKLQKGGALGELLRILERNRAGERSGVYSVCASHPLVLEAVMHQTLQDHSILLVEATANQVNQFGGYTGMEPGDYPAYVYGIADTVGLSRDRIILGGDHLGPLCWADEPADRAMAKAFDLISAYVSAGFQKIHLDASMGCAGELEPLSDTLVAERAVAMCKVAEQTAAEIGVAPPVYVIGTEVPVPGGATEGLAGLEVTPAQSAECTVNTHRAAFAEAGLDEAWQRVIALVVQPGVEFNHTDVHGYDPEKARLLSSAITKFPRLVYEAHSTDYQPVDAYHELTRDHFAILKVGPQLTFALREALFALAAIEEQLLTPEKQSNLLEVCERVMLREPAYWVNHYPATEPEGRNCRRFSYSDRIRYYWPHTEISTAVEQMMTNLECVEIPMPILSQYFPGAYSAVRAGVLLPTPHNLVINHIMVVSAIYSEACRENGQ